MCLVGRLVLREPDVAVGAEDLGLAELRLERRAQSGHRRPHRLGVDVLVRLPERLGVVDLEVVVEVERGDGKALELHGPEPRWRPGDVIRPEGGDVLSV